MRVPFPILRERPPAIAIVILLLAWFALGSAQGQKNHNSGLAWNPPNTDSKIPDLSATPPCDLQNVMKQTSERASEFVDDLQKFDAVEHSESAQTDTEAHTTVEADARFDFMAEFSTTNGHLGLKEARQELDHKDSDAAKLEDVGIPVLALIFHPNYSKDFTFECQGAAAWNGLPAWVVGFRQNKGAPSRLMAFRTPTGNFGAKLKGRGWIARDTGQIIHLETNLIEPIGLIGLMLNAVSIDFAPVQFHSTDVKLWLPVMAIAYSQYPKSLIVKKHTYTSFKLFSVGTQSVIGQPKIPGDNTGGAPAAAPGDKPADPVPPKQ